MLAISCIGEKTTETETIQHPDFFGSWEMAEVHWVAADTTYSIEKAQPGLFIFEPMRYSIMWTPTEEAREPFKNLSAPTPEETIAGFRSVVFNGGTFTHTDSTITTQANIAKVPGFEGGTQFYNYELEGERLTLTMFDETYPNGEKPQWFGKYETKFVLTRAK